MKNKGVKRVLAMAVATVLVLETLPSVTVFAEETESTSVQEDLTEPQQAQRKDRTQSRKGIYTPFPEFRQDRRLLCQPNY